MKCFIDGPAGYPFDIGHFLRFRFALSALIMQNYVQPDRDSNYCRV